MSIRRTLLLAFLFVGLGPSAILTLLAFDRAREAMQSEIEQSIAVQAASLSTELDRVLFERLENSATWSRLEVMQDIRVRDVDKRLSQFLSELKTGYGSVYRELYCTDTHGVKVASSDAASLGQLVTNEPAWDSARLSSSDITIAGQGEATGIAQTLAIRTAVPASLGSASPGTLTELFNLDELQRILDQASLNGRSILVVDEKGRTIAASARWRALGPGAAQSIRKWVEGRPDSAVALENSSPFGESKVIVGVNQFHDYPQFGSLRWTTVVVEDLDTALAPVHRMAMIFVALLFVVAAVTVAVALRATRIIAGPITELAALTRRYSKDQVLPDARASGPGEVGDLVRSFVQMIHESERARVRLVQASKLAALGEMAAILAHELRTPLGILLSSVQVFKRESSIGDEGRELASYMEAEIKRLNRLVSTMLDSATPRKPDLQHLELNQLIGKCIAMLANEATQRGIELRTRFAAEAELVEGDEEQLTQVILNLCLNAIQIVPREGIVEVSTTTREDRVEIVVADNGPGVAPEDRSRIFDAFFYKREGGVGLGLAVVNGIVEAHGGAIVVEESALGGAAFRFTLPRVL